MRAQAKNKSRLHRSFTDIQMRNVATVDQSTGLPLSFTISESQRPDVDKSDKAQANKVDFGRIQDLVTALIFDPWDQKRADVLLRILIITPTHGTTGLDSPASIAMERIERLSRMQNHAAMGKGDTGKIYEMIEQGHQRVLDLIKHCFELG